jgi:hypothetical protein
LGAGGGRGAALVVGFVWAGGFDCVVVDVGGRGPLGPLGYWRDAAPAARVAFDPEAPMVLVFGRYGETV